MTGFVIVDLTRGDQEVVRELILDGLSEHWGHVDPNLNGDLDDIVESYVDGRTIVVRDSRSVLGTGTVMPRGDGVAAIVRMSVRTDQRRGGIGRAIVDELVDTARGWGVDRVVLETTSAWTDVVNFYLRCGFEITHTTPSPFGEDTWFEMRLDDSTPT